jgi:hypothetical protein
MVRWDQSGFANLFEVLLRNVGIYLTAFVTEEQAEAWLLEESPDGRPLPTFDPVSKTCRTSGKLGDEYS